MCVQFMLGARMWPLYEWNQGVVGKVFPHIAEERSRKPEGFCEGAKRRVKFMLGARMYQLVSRET